MSSEGAQVWRWRLPAAVLILGAAALRVGYFVSDCPLDLAPDEAHYWDWSRHLDWSYYSKGPVVAYLIRAGCLAAGDWSVALTGTEMAAVRLPAVLCGSLLLLGLYVLTTQITRREPLAALVVAAALTWPVLSAGSSLMTIDSPYTCCWTWALVAGHHAVFRRSTAAWLLAGAVVGIGILAKYTMVLWLPSLGLFLLTTPACRGLLWQRGFWLMTAATAVCCLPILVWNAQNDWVTVRHISGLAGMAKQARTVHWLGPLQFVAVQFLLLLGVWFVVWLRAMAAHAPWRESRPELRYLWWMSAPMFLVFFVFGLKTSGGEPNWPVTAYISGLVLGAVWLDQSLRTATGWPRRLLLGSVAFACVLGLALTLLMYFSSLAYPVLDRLAGPPSATRPEPLRRFDPTCRLRGWRTLAAEVDRVRAELRREGVEPVLAASGWSLPGEVGFYCQGQPTVYSLGPVLGDRHSQYDFWRPNPVADGQHFSGRTFLFVGPLDPKLLGAFERVEPVRVVRHHVEGQPVASWTLCVCRGFRGFGSCKGNRQY